MASRFIMSLTYFNVPLLKNMNLANKLVQQCTRTLYAKSTLGIDAFMDQQKQIKSQMRSIDAQFKEKMLTYSNDDSKNMIFTEDLKNMIHIAENEEDIDLVVKMMKKFNQQNKQLRFGSFVFGTVVMRLFHIHNKADLALECFLSPELDGFFDQLMSYQLLLDLLYENQKYEKILELSHIIRDRQMDRIKYPKNIVVLTMAACYKMNNAKSLDFALNLWKELLQAGHFPMRRASTFCAGLALNQGNPEAALEILSGVKNQSYTTVRNIKVAALADVGRVEDAIPIMKSIILDDQPNNGNKHTFNQDVLEKVKNAVSKSDNPDSAVEVTRLQQLFEKQGQISDVTLDEQLCCEIQRPPMMNNRQDNRYSRFKPTGGNRFINRNQQRPGLEDIA